MFGVTLEEVFHIVVTLGVVVMCLGVWGIYGVLKNAANEHLKAMQALYDMLQKRSPH